MACGPFILSISTIMKTHIPGLLRLAAPSSALAVKGSVLRGGAVGTVSLALTGMLAAGEPGKLTREIWTNLKGSAVADFTSSPRYWEYPDSVSTFSGASAPQNVGTDFASRIRGYITAPVSGSYTFWIASDNSSELRISPNASKFGRAAIASVSGWVDPQAWDAKTSQKSATVALVAGQRYFIEVIHKEDGGGDHVEIAWKAPGGSRELIPASALESFTAEPNDTDNDELPDDWEAAHGFSLSDNGRANPSQHPLADPDHDGYLNLEEAQYGLDPNVRAGLAGSLLLETWNNLPGSGVEDLTLSPALERAPDKSEFVFSAATPVNRADAFGARMRGYVTAPSTGSYTFYISGDDSCQLFLSPSASQFAKQKIAGLSGWSSAQQWTKYASQKSASISLVAGQKYYIEAFHKESASGDHMEIGWKVPGSSSIVIIPGTALESYAQDVEDPDGDNMPSAWETANGLDPSVNDASADPDEDGIHNVLEYVSGTNPKSRNSLPGGLLHELWLGIPGTSVKALTSSPKFVQKPDFRDLVGSAQLGSHPYDGFGSRLRGYLTAPATGTYLFWVMGQDENELWLSSSDSKYDKQLLVRPSANASTFDIDISQKSRPVSLVAGQSYYIEVLHKDDHASDFCQVGWTRPGAAREVIPSSALRTYIPTPDDVDDDGLPDAWETANGLSSNDNGRIDPKNGAQGDFDGDGLDNAAEWKAGTRADLVDTDGDGVSDRDEVELMETQALMADAAPFESVAIIPGASFSATSGSWIQEDGKARQDCVRGWLDYPVTLADAGVHQLDLAFTPVAEAQASKDYEIVFSIDGHAIRRETVTVDEAAGGHAKVLTPWLPAGSHTLRVFIDNSNWFRRVTVDQLEILAARGPDANENGTPDWVDLRLAKYNSIEAPSESFVSPVCLEGKAKWSELATVAGAPVQAAPNDRWFSNVALDAIYPTDIAASFENGAIPVSRQIDWIPTNLLAGGTRDIRVGDSLKLSAFVGSSGTPDETVVITVEGQTATITADQPLIHTFAAAGSIPVQVTHSLEGDLTTATVMINVAGAPAMESPVCVMSQYREVALPGLPAGISLQYDNRIEIQSVSGTPSSGQVQVLRLNTLDDRTGVFRLGGAAGPIVGVIPFRAMRVRDAGETAMSVVGELGSNTFDVMMPVLVDGLHPDASLEYEIFISGVTFDDGALKKTLRIPADFTADGANFLHFYKSGTSGSSCHRLRVWQGATRIAYRQ